MAAECTGSWLIVCVGGKADEMPYMSAEPLFNWEAVFPACINEKSDDSFHWDLCM